MLYFYLLFKVGTTFLRREQFQRLFSQHPLSCTATTCIYNLVIACAMSLDENQSRRLNDFTTFGNILL